MLKSDNTGGLYIQMQQSIKFNLTCLLTFCHSQLPGGIHSANKVITNNWDQDKVKASGIRNCEISNL